MKEKCMCARVFVQERWEKQGESVGKSMLKESVSVFPLESGEKGGRGE